ncbi:MAG: MarR family winged helix-turn-helix transcriptional regulator [Janthinobacterium lividum]
MPPAAPRKPRPAAPANATPAAPPPPEAAPAGLTHAQFAAIADFRHELRRFLAFSESAAAAAGLPAQQHQALLAIAGHRGPAAPTVGLLAERLLVAPHTAAELAARMADAALLTRTPAPGDRRRTELALTDAARTLLHRLTDAHLRELDQLGPVLARALARPEGKVEAPPQTPPKAAPLERIP